MTKKTSPVYAEVKRRGWEIEVYFRDVTDKPQAAFYRLAQPAEPPAFVGGSNTRVTHRFGPEFPADNHEEAIVAIGEYLEQH